MHRLVDPLLIACCRVQRQDRSTVFVVQCCAFNPIDIRRRAAHWQKQRVHLWIVGHRCPAVRRAAHIGAARSGCLLVIRVARIERPAHVPADDVKAANHTTRHVGLNVVSDPTAHYHGRTGHQRRGRQLVIRVWHVAKTGFEIHLTLVAKALAELAGVGVNGNQARINGVGQHATLAIGPGRYGGSHNRRAIGLCRLGNRCGGIEVGHAAATLPHR